MPTTKLNNGQLPATLSSKTIDNTNDINTTTTRLKITGGSSGQVLSTDGSGNLSWATAGGVSDGDKGDITVSSSGSVWTIDNGVVTYAKLQDVSASSRLLGRATAGAGDAEEITIGSGLSLSGTTLSVSNSPIAVITKTADETVTSSTTIQYDDELKTTGISVLSKVYWIELDLLISRTNTTATPNFRFGFEGPTNNNNPIGYVKDASTNGPGVKMDGLTSGTITVSTNAGAVAPYKIFGSVISGSVNDDFRLLWAQGTSSGTGITVHKGSRMRVWEVA